MRSGVTIGLIGEFRADVTAHRAIAAALPRAAAACGVRVDAQWVATDEVTSFARVSAFNGLWCVPATPYRNMDGALLAIRWARENFVPFLGTCGGFQHAIVEYARNVLGWDDAEHGETAPAARRAVIAPLECALVEVTAPVRLFSGTRIASAYGAHESVEGYHCRYGLNRAFQAALVAGPLRAAAEDPAGEIRAVELDGHPFFVATLFQPERAALAAKPAPLVQAFVKACARTSAAG
jgi:CTP synthase (UTP-ammonia lyase)